MKALFWIALCAVLVTGCVTSGPLYYHERADGTRYYQSRTKALILVDKTGIVVEAPVMYAGAASRRLQKKGDDWDVSAFDVEPPPGYCLELLSRRPESCLHRIWEAPALALMAPVLLLPTPPRLHDIGPWAAGPRAAMDQR